MFTASGSEISDGVVLLCPMREEDCALVVRWRNKDRVRRNHVYRELLTEEGEREYFRARVASGEVVHLMARLSDSGFPFGCVVYHDFARERESAEGGLFIGEEACLGKGYGTRMLLLGAEYVRALFGVRTVTARVFEDNPASLAVHRSAGYVRSGTLPGVLCSDGERKDMILLERKSHAR